MNTPLTLTYQLAGRLAEAAHDVQRELQAKDREIERLREMLEFVTDAYVGRFNTPRGLVGPIDQAIEAARTLLQEKTT